MKWGMPDRKSRFICCKCLKQNHIGDGIQRGKSQRKKGHIKDLYCLSCKETTKNKEIRYCDDSAEIMEEAIKEHNVLYADATTDKSYWQKAWDFINREYIKLADIKQMTGIDTERLGQIFSGKEDADEDEKDRLIEAISYYYGEYIDDFEPEDKQKKTTQVYDGKRTTQDSFGHLATPLYFVLRQAGISGLERNINGNR